MDNINQHLTSPKILILTSISLALYSSMIVLQSFNADDIIQSQPISGDVNTFLAQGRWGYYLIYKVVQNTNPLGPASLIAGVFLLTLASSIASSTIGFYKRISSDFFIVISTVSLYYSSVLSFDSTRIAYPLATLIAILGVKLARDNRFFFSICCFALSPSIYPASTQVSLTLIFSLILILALRDESYKENIKKSAITFILLLLGLASYIASTHFSVILTGIPLSGRSIINPVAALYEYDRLLRLFFGHSIPNGYQMYYFSSMMKFSLWILISLFAITMIINVNKKNIFLVTTSFLGVLISPFALAFASPLNEFTPRALIAFAMVHALFAATPIDFFSIKGRNKLSELTTIVASAFIVFTSIQINGSAFDEYISSRNDVLATNRMISRIDEVVSASNIPLSGPIPIVVKYQNPVNMSPSGEPSTARSAPWSKEWIFRQIDPRFEPVPGQIGDKILKNAPTVKWPNPSSIYVDEGVVVVIIN